MTASNMPILSGLQTVDSGTGAPVAGSAPVYSASGALSAEGINPTNGILTTSATPSTTRAIYGKVSIGAGITQTGSGNLCGVRGELNIPSGTSAGEGFHYGSQGKAIVAGTVDQTSATRVCGVLAQLDVSAGTLTAGQISALWADWGATASTPASGECNVVRVTNTTAAVINALAYFYGKSTYLFDINSNSATWLAAAGTGGSSAGVSTGGVASKVLKVNVDGTAYYIPLFSSNS